MEQPVANVLNSILKDMNIYQQNGKNGQEHSLDGKTINHGTCGRTLLTIGELPPEQRALKPIGQPLGETGVAVKHSAEAPAAGAKSVAEALRCMPLQVLSWLRECEKQGWMATRPERTEANLTGSRAKLVEVYRLWFPKNSPEEQAAKVNAVMQTLVVYGYGALPSDPVQAKAKINMFCKVLEEVPAWAVEAAGVWWVKTVEDSPPAPAQLLSRARLEMGWYDKLDLGEGCEMEFGRVYEKVKGWIKNDA